MSRARAQALESPAQALELELAALGSALAPELGLELAALELELAALALALELAALGSVRGPVSESEMELVSEPAEQDEPSPTLPTRRRFLW